MLNTVYLGDYNIGKCNYFHAMYVEIQVRKNYKIKIGLCQLKLLTSQNVFSHFQLFGFSGEAKSMYLMKSSEEEIVNVMSFEVISPPLFKLSQTVW